MKAAISVAEGSEENGFAIMLSELLRQNLDDHPHKLRDFRKLLGRVAIVVEDADVAVTLEFDRGRLVVHSGIVGIPDVTIRAGTDEITRMSLVELLPFVQLPDLRREVARDVLVTAGREGRITIYGMWTNLPLLLRLTRVMSVN